MGSFIVQLRVKELARQKGVSQASLARLSNLSSWTIKKVWGDPSYNIGLQTLGKIARALDVSVCELIEESQEEHADQGLGTHQ